MAAKSGRRRRCAKLSLEEKVGQLFMVWVRAEFLNVNSPEYLELRETMSKYHVGSFAMTVPWEPPFLYRSEPYEAAELLNRLQQDSKLPLLFAADFERGVTMRLRGATPFPHAMAFGAAGKEDYAKAFGRITARRISRGRHPLEFFSRRRRQFQSGEPHHQYALVRGGSRAGWRPGRGLHSRRTRRRNDDNGQTLSLAMAIPRPIPTSASPKSPGTGRA